METPAIITIKNKALAQIWGVSEAHASTQGRPAHLPGIKDGGIWLQKALQLRPIVIPEAIFEQILASEATCMQGDPVTVARDQGLHAWYYSENPSRDLRGLRIDDATRIAIEREAGQVAARMRAEAVAAQIEEQTADRAQIEQAVAASPDSSPRQVAGDLLAQARLAKINAEIERNTVRARKESGELIERAEVQQGIEAAGTIVRTTLESLPHELADLVPPDMRSEVRAKAEKAIDRALHAIVKALSLEDAYE